MAFPFANPFGRPSTVQAYSIARSLRFNSGDSAYLARTFGSTGSQQTFTLQFRVKRSALGATGALFASGGSSAAFFYIGISSSNTIFVQAVNSSVQPS